MTGVQHGIEGDYPPASHLSEELLWRGYRGLHDTPEEALPPMSDLEIRQRHMAALTIEAEERVAHSRARMTVVR